MLEHSDSGMLTYYWKKMPKNGRRSAANYIVSMLLCFYNYHINFKKSTYTFMYLVSLNFSCIKVTVSILPWEESMQRSRKCSKKKFSNVYIQKKELNSHPLLCPFSFLSYAHVHCLYYNIATNMKYTGMVSQVEVSFKDFE